MAEKKVIEIDVNTKDAVKAMENLSKATHDVSASFEEVYGDLQPLTTRMGEAEDRLYELANAGKTTTQEYKDLLKTVGDYRKVQIQTDLAVDAAATTMGQKLGGALGGVTSGFSVAQGAMGALGSESAELEKTLLKVQSALAIQQGFQGIKEAIPSFVQLKNSAVGAFQGMTTASKAFAATGIGLLITAVALLVANMDDIKKSFNSGLASAQKYAESTEKQAEAARHAVDNFDEYARTLRRVGFEEDEINNKRKAAFAKAIKETENQLKAQKKLLSESKKGLETAQAFDAFGLNATGRWLYGDEEDVKANRAKAKEIADQLTKLKNDKYEFDAEQKKAKEDAKKEAAEAAKERAKENSDRRKEIREKAADEAKAKKEIVDKADADAKRNALEKQQEFDNQIEAIAEQNYLNTLTEQEKEIQLANDKYFELETLATGNKDQLAAIELAKMNELNDINLKYQDIAFQADKEAKDKKAAADKEAAAKEIAEAKAVAEQKAAIQMQGLDTALQGVQLIKGLFEKQKGVQKAAVIAESAIGIAKMIIANKLANVAALATPQAVATSGAAAAPVIAMNNISTGIGIAANIAATAKALQTLGGGTPPTDPSGGGGGTSGSVMSPNFNIVGNSGLNQLSQLQQKPTKAYVVSGDMTTAQSLDRNRIENATLVQ